MSSDGNCNEFPVNFDNGSAFKDCDEEKSAGQQCEKPIKCPERNGRGGKLTETSGAVRKSKQNMLQKFSIANIVIGLMNISIGIAVFTETKQLSHWLTDCAFSVWYGCLVFATGISGVGYARRRSKLKGIIHILFNVVSLILTIPSLAFYGKAVTHYHKIRTGKITVTCEKKYSHDNCNEKYESLATTAAALYGLLLVANLVEIVLSMFLCAMSASFRCFCKKVFLSADSAHISECSMYYPGHSYTTNDMYPTHYEYHIDPTPLKPLRVCQKVCKSANVVRSSHHQPRKIVAPRKKPQFKAMESITESIESTDCENEITMSTNEEKEVCQREGLLPQAV